MKKLIAIIDNPLAITPGHTIKEAKAPHCPVASVCVLPEAAPRIKRERRKLALAMAAAPDMLAALHIALRHIPTKAMEYSEGSHGARVFVSDVVRAAITKAEGPRGRLKSLRSIA